MKQKEMQAVLIRVEKSKYLKLRHGLLDEGVTVSKLINQLIDKHLSRREQRGNRSDETTCNLT